MQRAPLLVLETDAELKLVGLNDRAARALQTSRDAALGRPLAELLPVDGGADTWRDLLASNDDDDAPPQVITVEHPQIGRRDLELWVQPAGADQPTTIFAHDVTERVALAKRRLLESTVLGAIENTLDVSLWALDRDGVYLLQEGKGNETAGLRDNQYLGRSLFEIYGHEGMEPIKNAIAGEASHSPPMPLQGIHIESWYVPVYEPGCDAAMVGITLNVTEAKRREDELLAKLEVIERQRETIRELSTPIIEVWDDVLALPIVGLVDSVRTAELMDNLLQTITRTRSRFAILDLTGVQDVDTSTASHLIGLIQAIRLLGAEGVLTGIHPNIAQTIVAIGVDLRHVRIFAKLRDALKHCLAQLNQRRR